ncbi:leucine-rich repeat domain-containing protein [Spirosoma soli]|uniref:Leucine-rich repeat domain-containing protein n=1 Tax=Spirosoma soli TaxID=1770529 RepID=A0ABW5M7Z0_9BACT
MKKLILFVLLMLPTLTSLAQVKVMAMKDSIDYKTLRSRYPAAVSPKEQATSRDLAFQKLAADYWSDFNRFLKKKGFRPDTSIILYTEGYFQPNGRADLLLYQYTMNDIRPSPKIEKQFLFLLSEYLSDRPLPVSSSLVWSTFRLAGSFFISKSSSRKTPKGPGIIGDLATAARTTRPDTVKRVMFNNLGLEQLPEVIYRFTNANEIDLGNNYLTSLPARLTALPRLEKLNLMSNRLRDDSVAFSRNTHVKSINIQKNSLTGIPPSIAENRRLESLWLGNNDLKTIHAKTLRRLHKLNDLNLYNTGLTELPKNFGRMHRLVVLDLYYNKLTTLPRSMRRMKRLEQLALAHNQLKELPMSITKLRRLQVAFVHHNRIGQLPTSFRVPNLRVFDLSYNEFTVAPAVLATLPSLEELDLSNNNLQDIPKEFGGSTHLKKLYLRSNPLSRDDAKKGPYAQLIEQLEANKTEVFY